MGHGAPDLGVIHQQIVDQAHVGRRSGILPRKHGYRACHWAMAACRRAVIHAAHHPGPHPARLRESSGNGQTEP
jgi:hypothetical protein